MRSSSLTRSRSRAAAAAFSNSLRMSGNAVLQSVGSTGADLAFHAPYVLPPSDAASGLDLIDLDARLRRAAGGDLYRAVQVARRRGGLPAERDARDDLDLTGTREI